MTDKELIFLFPYNITNLEIMWLKPLLGIEQNKSLLCGSQNYTSDKGWVSKFPGVAVLIHS